MQRRTFTFVFAWLGALAGSVVVARVDGASLADLIAGGTIQQGNEVFSNFSYSGSGAMPSAADVAVVGITSTLGNYGIEFQGGFQDLAGDGGSAALIKYTVSILGSGDVITDAHLDSDLTGVAGTRRFAGFGAIIEGFTHTTPPNPPLGLSFVTNFNLNNKAELLHSDYVWGLPGYTSISVSKSIFLDAVSGTLQLSYVDQTFSQQVGPVSPDGPAAVPLPTAVTTGLSTLGAVAGLGLLRRRRRLF